MNVAVLRVEGSDDALDTGVAIVSLRHPRPIVFRSKTDKSVEYSYMRSSGSLLYMSKEIQDHWQHAIPSLRKRKPVLAIPSGRLRSEPACLYTSATTFGCCCSRSGPMRC